MGETSNIRQGLIDGGVECAIEVFDWSTGVVLIDPMDLNANKRKAKALERRIIEEYQQGYPGRPVPLVGVSAGTGLIVWALEDLAPGRHVESAFLIAPSLRHKYDLSWGPPAPARLPKPTFAFSNRDFRCAGSIGTFG